MGGGCLTNAMLHNSVTSHKVNPTRGTLVRSRCYNFTFIWFFQYVRGIDVIQRQQGSDGNLEVAGAITNIFV
jgi:hypothetical protein